jgi:hypothetical protein
MENAIWDFGFKIIWFYVLTFLEPPKTCADIKKLTILEHPVTHVYQQRHTAISQVAMSTTATVYDGLEILCALAPNTGLRLRVRNRRSITPLPLFVIGVKPKRSLSI